MDLKKQISDYIDAHEEELLQDVMQLCRIDSVRGESREGKPYGDGPYEALMAAKELCEKYGFATSNYDNCVIAADMNDKAAQLDILAHMDVVAAGDGWTVTEPFEPVIKDGKLYGRGSSDDKGPAMAALYAMRAVKELGIPVTKRCRLILGSDEECGSSDIVHYYDKEQEAPMTFSPDSEFPVTNVEKGQFRCDMTASFAASDGARRLLQMEGGTTTNIVPGKAFAVVKGFEAAELGPLMDAAAGETGVSFTANGTAAELRIDAIGQGAHASTPKEGKNAALALLKLINRLPIDACAQKERLAALEACFPYGDHYGDALGIHQKDEISGDTTVSLDILRVTEEAVFAKFDARTSIAATDDNTVKAAANRLEQAGFAADTSFNPPHAVAADSPFIKTLLEVYEAVTGKAGRCVAIGGGTYVHSLKNGVAFGAVGETTDTHMHGADEFMLIQELKEAAVIYALAIAKLCE